MERVESEQDRERGTVSDQGGARAVKDDLEGWKAAKAERAEEKPDEKKRVEPWIEVCQQRNYTVSADDVGHVLKLEVVPVDAKTGNERAQPQNVITGRVIPAPEPPRRNLVKIAHNSTPEPRTFTTATYNVLADLYCNSDMRVRAGLGAGVVRIVDKTS